MFHSCSISIPIDYFVSCKRLYVKNKIVSKRNVLSSLENNVYHCILGNLRKHFIIVFSLRTNSQSYSTFPHQQFTIPRIPLAY